MSIQESETRAAVFLPPGEGRSYRMGRIRAIFKADGDETESGYSISEWWLEPNTQGPGAHAHDEDEVFYVIEGTMSFFIGDRQHVEQPEVFFEAVETYLKGAWVAEAKTIRDLPRRTQASGKLEIHDTCIFTVTTRRTLPDPHSIGAMD